MRDRGIDLIAADNPSSFIDDTPTAKLVRQVLGAISEFDKERRGGTVQGVRGKQPKRHDPRRSGGIYHSSIEESSLPVRGSAAKIRCYLLQTKQS